MIGWLSDRLARSRRIREHEPLTIRNVTRGTVLARNVATADDAATRRKGLLSRTGLGVEDGLWIVPCESVHTFFMKFAIDLVYLDRSKRVKKVSRNVGPWRMSACLSAVSILELAPGTIDRSQTRRGDQLEFSSGEAFGEEHAKAS